MTAVRASWRWASSAGKRQDGRLRVWDKQPKGPQNHLGNSEAENGEQQQESRGLPGHPKGCGSWGASSETLRQGVQDGLA